MNILAHRGWWRERDERNTVAAFVRAFAAGFGVETDIRDDRGRLVVAHDPPSGQELSFHQFLALLPQPRGLPLALNIKSDGIAEQVAHAVKIRGVTDWFTFDMSIPDTVRQRAAGVRYFLRMSEVEQTCDPLLFRDAAGIWLDAFFDSGWCPLQSIGELLAAGKDVCLVSPELHGRPHAPYWARLASAPDLVWHPRLALCTDYPRAAATFFRGPV